MTYTPNKPDPGPSPALDAPIIQANFSSYATIFANNHVPLNDRFQGDHNTIIFQNQTGDPGVTTNLTALYAKNATSKADTQPQLFVQIPKFLPTALDTTDAPNVGMQLTFNTVGLAPPYYSFLPGGYLMYWGVETGVLNKNTQLNVTVILTPTPQDVYMALAQPQTILPTGIPTTLSVATTIDKVLKDRFVINSKGYTLNAPNSINYSILWLAIGKA